MLSPQSWLHLAEGLDIGRKRRHDHDCGPGKTLIVSRDDRGYSAYCWRCSDHGWAPGPQESLSDKLERLARLRAGDEACTAIRGKPEPAVYDVDSWPTAAVLWFYKAGLSRSDIGTIGAYYHAPSGRVVLPVWGAGCKQASEPAYWQARALDGRYPKYLSQPYRPPSLIARWGSAPSPTLCEDILSAYKVGLVGEGWAVMGTAISASYISEIMRRGCAVNLWLDPDAAGRRAAAKYRKQLQAYGVRVMDIQSTLDPKKHTRDDIKEYLDALS